MLSFRGNQIILRDTGLQVLGRARLIDGFWRVKLNGWENPFWFPTKPEAQAFLLGYQIGFDDGFDVGGND